MKKKFKNALITGAGKRIGSEIAYSLCSDGWNVVLHYNTSKRGITLNLESINGQKIFKQLALSADVILDPAEPGYLSSLGIGYDDLSKDNAKLIMCSITEFGQTGPWKDYKMSDL